jgi:hypothetical protein
LFSFSTFNDHATYSNKLNTQLFDHKIGLNIASPFINLLFNHLERRDLMKKFILGAIIATSFNAFSQEANMEEVTYDPVAHKKEIFEIQKPIFDEIKKYDTTTIISFFKNSKSIFDNVVTKSKKGDVISHESLSDKIYSEESYQNSESFNCYDEENNSVNYSLEEDNVEARAFLKNLGYESIEEVYAKDKKIVCELVTNYDESADLSHICNPIASTMRLTQQSLLEKELINIQQKYYDGNATDADLIAHGRLEDLKWQLERTLEYIEYSCIARNNFTDLESALDDMRVLLKDGAVIEFNRIKKDRIINQE